MSFKCHGCNHHASFHALENPGEDAVLAKWSAQALIKQDMEDELQLRAENLGAAGRKRRRITGQTYEQGEIVEFSGGEVAQGSGLAANGKGASKERPK